MPSLQTDHLFQLVKSLSKSEKRNFKLFVGRTNQHTKFTVLFDVLDRMEEYDEVKLLKRAPEIKPQQLSNLKANLYKHLLESLRIINARQDIEIELREQLDYAKVLYNKGLYGQSLRILDKIKQRVREIHRNTLLLEILEFEKKIEVQYITRSVDTRAEEISKEITAVVNYVHTTNVFSNLALRLYDMYVKVGHVKTDVEGKRVKEFFNTNLPEYREEDLDFFELLYLYQAFVWYNLIIQDFLMCYRYAQKWVNLFDDYPEMKKVQPDLYITGYNNLLESLFMMLHTSQFEKVLNKLEQIDQELDIVVNDNIRTLLFQYIYTHRLNLHFMKGEFTKGLGQVEDIKQGLERYHRNFDANKLILFDYKIGCLYFGAGDFRNAIRYLVKVIQRKDGSIRTDMHSFARILNLIAHYELGNQDLVDREIVATYRFLGQMKELNLVQEEIFGFLRNIRNIYPGEVQKEFKKLHASLMELTTHPFEKRPFLYLDIISWLESKIESRPIEEVIREKYELRRV